MLPPPPSLKAPKGGKLTAELLRKRQQGLATCISALAAAVLELQEEMTELYSVYCKGFDTVRSQRTRNA